MIHRKRRVCIKRDAFDSRLDVYATNFARDSDDCDCGADDNGCANAVAVNGVRFYGHRHQYRHHQALNENSTTCMNQSCSSLRALNG